MRWWYDPSTQWITSQRGWGLARDHWNLPTAEWWAP